MASLRSLGGLSLLPSKRSLAHDGGVDLPAEVKGRVEKLAERLRKKADKVVGKEED
jgi:hypothetical protein